MRAYIIENSEIVRGRLAFMLAEIEWLELVGQAGSIKAATENIFRLQPDVVLLDIKLSDGNGLDLLESLQAQGLKTRAIVMTFDPHPQFRKRAMELGAVCFIDKAKELGNIRLMLGQMVAEQHVFLKAA